jgi:signal transduction histidine kinase
LLTLRIVKPDGSIIWIEQNSVPIFNDENICIGFEGIVRDITTRKSLEQDLSRLDRLNAIGQMAASVAHEIRNPMTTVRGYLQFFSNKNEFSNYKKQFTLLIDELDRTNQIIKEYLSLSQHRSIELESMQINEIIEALYPLINADAVATNKEVKLNLKPTSNLYLDQKEIRQLILNLVRNGLEAMKPGSYITIHTYNEGHEVVLGIQDNGPGIPSDILEHIGKPFMTTKDTGTGLGLAICYRIANRHQAKITVDSSTSGTTFLIRFKIPSEPNNLPLKK